MEPDDAARLDRLERQVQFLLRAIGVDPDTAAADGAEFSGSIPVAGVPSGQLLSPEVAELAARNPIQAIKLYRQMTGVGLKEAKDVIDSWRAGMQPPRRRR